MNYPKIYYLLMHQWLDGVISKDEMQKRARKIEGREVGHERTRIRTI